MYLNDEWDEPEFKEHTCKWCRGSGRVKVESNSSLEYTCPDCNGRGTYQPKVNNDEV